MRQQFAVQQLAVQQLEPRCLLAGDLVASGGLIATGDGLDAVPPPAVFGALYRPDTGNITLGTFALLDPVNHIADPTPLAVPLPGITSVYVLSPTQSLDGTPAVLPPQPGGTGSQSGIYLTVINNSTTFGWYPRPTGGLYSEIAAVYATGGANPLTLFGPAQSSWNFGNVASTGLNVFSDFTTDEAYLRGSGNLPGHLPVIFAGQVLGSSAPIFTHQATVPGIPAGVTGTAGNSQVSLSWTAPASTGGAAITDYVVQYSIDAGSTWTTVADGTSATTSATVSGLTNDTAYRFRVAAANGIGTGRFSAISDVLTPSRPAPKPDGIDLDGDSRADLLWVHDSGLAVGWLMNPSTGFAGSRPLGGDPDWALEAAADLNGNGVADLLWRHLPTGSTILWIMGADGSITSATAIGGDLEWSIEATGDFDGDGRHDIIWRHAPTGFNILWLMDGTTTKSSGSIGGGADWRLAPTSDRFDSDGDGTTDLIWRHASGAHVLWRMDGLTVRSAQGIGGDLAWSLVASGDFDGDGRGDLLWRHTSGVVVQWLMNDGAVRETRAIGGDPTWSVVATGDFNGNRRSDIFWRHVSGITVVALMNGLDTLSVQGVGGDASWRLFVNTPRGNPIA